MYVIVKIEYNEHIKIYLYIFVEIDDKQAFYRFNCTTGWLSRSFETALIVSSVPVFFVFLSCTIATITNDRLTRPLISISRQIVSKIVSIKDHSILDSVDWYLLFYNLSLNSRKEALNRITYVKFLDLRADSFSL